MLCPRELTSGATTPCGSHSTKYFLSYNLYLQGLQQLHAFNECSLKSSLSFPTSSANMALHQSPLYHPHTPTSLLNNHRNWNLVPYEVFISI